MNNTNHNIVTRYAPSPTGFQHIGGIRTALYAYFWARKNSGAFILRIEDTDKAREVEGSIEHVKEALTWLGIDWDFGPDKPGPFGSCIQSERLPIYKEYAERLIEKDLAYPDPYTEAEVQTFREAAQAEDRPFLFRNHRPETFGEWDGSQPLRLKVPEVKRYHWQDAVRGELEAGEEMLDDIILIKKDGYPTYNFAHIVDDNEMGVTHVMRGDEFISSMPKFLSLYDALEIPYPIFVSLPPILNDDRTKKLGKRDGAKDILEYRTEGYLPETMVNFLALTGWNPGTEQELFSKEELIANFALEQIQRSGAAFNQEKLLWMNKSYLDKLDATTFFSYVKDTLPETVLKGTQYSDERLHKLLPTIHERVASKQDVIEAAEAGEYDFAFSTPVLDPAMLQWKKDPELGVVKPRLEKVLSLLSEANFTSLDTIKEAIWSYAEEVGKGEVLWPLRVALTGRERSPDPFTVAYILGKDETLSRLKAACDKIDG